MKTLGETLSDMVRYGDIHEAPWPDEWLRLMTEEGINYQTLHLDDPELFTRCNIAASILRLTHDTPGGSWSINDDVVKPFLKMKME